MVVGKVYAIYKGAEGSGYPIILVNKESRAKEICDQKNRQAGIFSDSRDRYLYVAMDVHD